MSKRDWVYVITSLGMLFVFLIVYNYIRYNDIEKNKLTSCGVITFFGNTTKGTTIIEFYFYHNNLKVKHSVGNGYFEDCEKTGWCIGKCFEVEYSSKNPKNSRMNFDKPCECDSLLLNRN